jgi:hypothetical protein
MSGTIGLRSLVDLSKEDVERALAEHGRSNADVTHSLEHLGDFAASVAAQELNKVLDADVYKLLAQAWIKVAAVREAAARSKATPGQPTLVALSSQEFTYSCEPVLKLYIADVALPELRLNLEVTARFSGVRLSIADSRLRSFAPGDASAVARLTLKGVKLKEKITPVWKLPVEVTLGTGVPIT